jgi:hypothetical protein
MDQGDFASLLAITQAMADELTTYLQQGDRLYQPMHVQTPGGTEDPVLTVGALLENLGTLRSAAGRLTQEQRDALFAIENKVAHDRRALPAQWRAMLERELKALLDSWKWYLDDAEADQRSRDRYKSEVHNRTRIDLVMRTLAEDEPVTEQQTRLAGLDARLRAMWKPGPYIGPAVREADYPPDRAWWLYGRPAKDDW